MDGTKTRASGGKTISSSRTDPLKPKPGLSGPSGLFQVAQVTSLSFFVNYGLKTIFKKVPANSAVPIP